MLINLEKTNLGIVFFFSLIAALLLPLFWPTLRLFYFVPFLILIFYQKSFLVALWWSLACGLFVDLTASSSRLGFYAIDYLLVTWLLYEQRRHFFADRLMTLPMMTFAFSFLVTLFQIPLIYLFEGEVVVGLQWLFTDLLIMPAYDGLSGYIIFILLPGFAKRYCMSNPLQ